MGRIPADHGSYVSTAERMTRRLVVHRNSFGQFASSLGIFNSADFAIAFAESRKATHQTSPNQA